MANACQFVPDVDRFAPGALSFLDCQARTLGTAGYQVLATPGSSASVALAAMLTIFVAIAGYRLLFGEVPTARDGVLAFVKIGIVLALATSWPAYQTFVYDVAMNAPAELALEVGGAAGLVDEGGLAGRLDASDQAFRTLAVYGTGQLPLGADGQFVRREPGLFLGFDTFALGASRALFLASAVGAFALVRLLTGLLLAIGPLFIAFLLFDGTRGLFEGWARGLIGLALAGLATSLVLAVELALLEPWLSALLARRAVDLDIVGVPVQLLALVAVFAVTLATSIGLTARVGWGLRLPLASRITTDAVRHDQRTNDRTGRLGDRVPTELRSRALATADAIATSQRREDAAAGLSRPILLADGIAASRPGRPADAASVVTPRLTQGFNRRTRQRVSASATRRDRG